MAGRACAVILAAGRGQRAGGKKQFVRVKGRSLLVHATTPFLACREVGSLVLVVPSADVERTRREVRRYLPLAEIAVVAGGRTRNESSRRGLAAIPPRADAVLIHDAARPFATPGLIRRVLRAARRVGAALPAVAVNDSTVEIDGRGRLSRYHDRDRLRAVQTPQAFRREVLEDAFRRSRRKDFTDDASVVRSLGGTVAVVEGDPANRKITSESELRAALARLGG